MPKYSEYPDMPQEIADMIDWLLNAEHGNEQERCKRIASELFTSENRRTSGIHVVQSTSARIAALERDLAEANSLAHSRAMTIERLEGELAAAQQRLFAFYSGNPTGGIVASLERDLAAALVGRDDFKAAYLSVIQERKKADAEAAALLRIKEAADVLYSEAEEFDLPDGLGMGASQQYWDDLADALFPDDSGEVIQADLEKVQAAVDGAWEAFNKELNKPEFLPCGHHHSLMLKSAETGEPLYCELCDCISRRNDFETERDEARAEAAALRVDAERYRWLRNCTFDKFSGDIDDRLYVACDDAIYSNKWALHSEELDAAIDAARKESDK